MYEMKDSGIEWIGKIPKDWGIQRLKYLCTFSKGLPITKADLKPSGKSVISYGQVHARFNTGTTLDSRLIRFVDEKYEKLSPQSICHKNDYIFADTSEDYEGVGNCVFIDTDDCIFAGYHTFIASPIKFNGNPKFLAYLFQSDTWRKQIRSKVSGIKVYSITQKIMKNVEVIYPNSLEGQNKIVDFLDSKCGDIDTLSADIEKQIETLKEYKKSLITRAVTKGIDPNAETKDTASPYWSRIPVNWFLSDIKYLFEIVKRIAGKEGYDILSVTQKGLRIKDISKNEGQIAENYSNYQFVYPGDFVMNHMDLLTGWVDLSRLFGVTSPDYRVFRLRNAKKNCSSYYKYVMQCCYSCRIFYSLGQGVSNLGRWRLQTFSFNNFQVPVPPLQEQQAIADFLDSKCAEINAVISGKEKQLETLKEYKKSLIYTYVTGKKEVPCLE